MLKFVNSIEELPQNKSFPQTEDIHNQRGPAIKFQVSFGAERSLGHRAKLRVIVMENLMDPSSLCGAWQGYTNESGFVSVSDKSNSGQDMGVVVGSAPGYSDTISYFEFSEGTVELNLIPATLICGRVSPHQKGLFPNGCEVIAFTIINGDAWSKQLSIGIGVVDRKGEFVFEGPSHDDTRIVPALLQSQITNGWAIADDRPFGADYGLDYFGAPLVGRIANDKILELPVEFHKTVPSACGLIDDD